MSSTANYFVQNANNTVTVYSVAKDGLNATLVQQNVANNKHITSVNTYATLNAALYNSNYAASNYYCNLQKQLHVFCIDSDAFVLL